MGAESFAFFRAPRSNVGMIEPAQGAKVIMPDPKGERERERVPSINDHLDRVSGPCMCWQCAALAHRFVYIKAQTGGIGARDVPQNFLSAPFGIVKPSMASTFFHWLRSPAAREYFFSMFTITLVLDRPAHGWLYRHSFLGTRSCLPTTPP